MVESALGSGCRISRAVGPQHRHEVADLGKNGARRSANRGQRFLRLVGAHINRRGCHTCVETDHRDLVRDSVVQIAGDPQTLLAHPTAGFGFPRSFSPLGSLLDRRDIRTSRSRAITRSCAERDDESELQDAGIDDAPHRAEKRQQDDSGCRARPHRKAPTPTDSRGDMEHGGSQSHRDSRRERASERRSRSRSSASKLPSSDSSAARSAPSSR